MLRNQSWGREGRYIFIPQYWQIGLRRSVHRGFHFAEVRSFRAKKRMHSLQNWLQVCLIFYQRVSLCILWGKVSRKSEIDGWMGSCCFLYYLKFDKKKKYKERGAVVKALSRNIQDTTCNTPLMTRYSLFIDTLKCLWKSAVELASLKTRVKYKSRW